VFAASETPGAGTNCLESPVERQGADTMYDDNDDVEYLDREDRIANEKLERVGGVLVEPEHSQVDCNRVDDACAPDDYPADPYAIDNRPGTPDDTGYSPGLLSPDASDISFVLEGGVREAGASAPATEREFDLGTADETELWRRNEPLVEEDVNDGLKLPLGMDDADGERVLGAMGDESGEAAPANVEGTSATGGPTSSPDHGGFPERDG